MTTPVKVRRGEEQSTNTRRAWVAVALIPVAFFLAFAVGEGLFALLGHQPEDATAPLWVELVAAVPAVALFLLPCLAAVRYGNRARAEGDRAAVVPMAVGAALGLWMVLANAVGFLASVLTR